MTTARITLDDVLEIARRYIATTYPGDVPTEVRIRLLSGRKLDVPVPPAVAAPVLPAERHAPDFRSVHWHGVEYTFSPIQAAIVRQLWEARATGTPDVGGETLLDAAGSESGRVSPLFQGHTAWGTLIVPGSVKGTYRLAGA